jgi:lysozyme
MNISDSGIQLIKQFEGLELKAYHCGANVLTIGYGHTGAELTESTTITPEQAEDLLRKDIERFEEAVNRHVKVPLNQNQFDALVSWTYNLGETNLRNSTMLKELNAENYDAVPAEMQRWIKAGGKVVFGLVRRRAKEAQLFRAYVVQYSFLSKSHPRP